MTSARVCAPPAGHLLTPQNAALLFTGDVSTPLPGSARWTALLVKNAVSTVCQERGHAGCCDNSPGRHATAHFLGRAPGLSGRTNRARTGIGATSASSCPDSRGARPTPSQR